MSDNPEGLLSLIEQARKFAEANVETFDPQEPLEDTREPEA